MDDKIADLSAKLAKIRESLGNEKRRASVLSQMLDSAKVGKPRNYLSPCSVAKTMGPFSLQYITLCEELYLKIY